MQGSAGAGQGLCRALQAQSSGCAGPSPPQQRARCALQRWRPLTDHSGPGPESCFAVAQAIRFTLCISKDVPSPLVATATAQPLVCPHGLTRPPDAPATPQATKLGGKCPAYYKCPKGSTQPTSSNNACPGYKLAAAGGRALCVCFRVFAELTGCNSDHTAHRVRPKARHVDVVRVLLDDVKELLHLQRTAGETHQMLAACCAAPSGREKLWPELGLMSGNFHLGLHKTASPACGTEARKGCTQMKGTCTPGMQFCGWALEVFAIALAAHDAVTASALGSCRCTLGRSLPCMCETGCMSA